MPREETQPSFQITHDVAPSETLIAGFSSFGLAGLTAVDYLVNQLDLEETGHVTVDDLPSITPFQNGAPRHHTRLFSRPDFPVTVLVNELFVPVFAADPLADAILEWTAANGVEEITVLSGIPVPHGPDDHHVFYVATEDYQQRRLEGVDIPAMGNGFLDGVNSSLIGQGMETDLRVGVYVTPVHAQVPDVEAAIRLVDGVELAYDIDVDTAELEGFASDVEQYYGELADRLETVEKEHRPEDRMYM